MGLGIHIFANGQSSCRSVVEDPDKCLLTASDKKRACAQWAHVGLCEYRPTGRLRWVLASTSSRMDSDLVGRWSKTPTNACVLRLPRKGLALNGIFRTLRVPTCGEAAVGLGIHIFANGQSSCRSVVEDPDKCLLTASAKKRACAQWDTSDSAGTDLRGGSGGPWHPHLREWTVIL